MSSPNSLLQATDLRVSYGAFEVIKGISLSVKAGESLAIIGPNGAGKTTMFKALTGEVSCRSGKINFAGKDVTAMLAHQRTIEGMGRTFQVSRVFLELTSLENVVVAVESRRRNRSEPTGAWWRTAPPPELIAEAMAFLDQLGIAQLRHEKAATLSHGDKKRLELTLALALEPKILMLDEPTAGMAPADRTRIIEVIRDIRKEKGLSLVMTEHDMDVIYSLSDSVMVMNYGEVIAAGSVDEVRSNPMVREVYLGQDVNHAAG